MTNTQTLRVITNQRDILRNGIVPLIFFTPSHLSLCIKLIDIDNIIHKDKNFPTDS